MVLKCGVQISLGAVTRIARLGKQRKVGQGQTGGQCPVFHGSAPGTTGRKVGVNEGAGETQEQRET